MKNYIYFRNSLPCRNGYTALLTLDKQLNKLNDDKSGLIKYFSGLNSVRHEWLAHFQFIHQLLLNSVRQFTPFEFLKR